MTQTQMTTYLADKIGISKRQAKSALDELNELVTRQLKKEGLLRLAGYQLVKLVECGLCLPLADADLVGQVGRHLRLRHPPPPKPLLILNKMNDRSAKFKIGLVSTAREVVV